MQAKRNNNLTYTNLGLFILGEINPFVDFQLFSLVLTLRPKSHFLGVGDVQLSIIFQT